MKLGFNQACCMKKSSLELDLRLCEKHGYDCIELRLDMLKAYLQRGSLMDLDHFFKNSRLRPWAFNSIENINFNTQNQWNDLLDLFKFGCEASQAIGCRYLIVVPTMGEPAQHKAAQEVFEDSVACLSRLAEIAKPYQVKLAFEPIGDSRWCVRTLPQAIEIIDAVGCPDVGLALDSINLFLYNRLENINDLDLVNLDRIFTYHISDCENQSLGVLDHCHRLFPGEGVIPLDAITKKLHQKGYKGACSVELFRPEYWKMPPEQVIELAAEKTRIYL